MSKIAKKSFQTPKGTVDILPDDQKYWDKIHKVVREVATDYGYEKIENPLF